LANLSLLLDPNIKSRKPHVFKTGEFDESDIRIARLRHVDQPSAR
jgi:hypothetical protein